jgi:hypothetical protein
VGLIAAEQALHLSILDCSLFQHPPEEPLLVTWETAADADGRRQRQAEVAAKIVAAQTRPNSSYIVFDRSA